jgi:hypothetical protein
MLRYAARPPACSAGPGSFPVRRALDNAPPGRQCGQVEPGDEFRRSPDSERLQGRLVRANCGIMIWPALRRPVASSAPANCREHARRGVRLSLEWTMLARIEAVPRMRPWESEFGWVAPQAQR